MDNLVVGLEAFALGPKDTNVMLVHLNGGIDGGRSAGGRGGSALGVGTWRALRLRDPQSERNNVSDVRFGTVHLDGDAERLAKKAHALETLLVVGTTTADENAGGVINERSLVLFKSTNDALESRGDVGKVGDTTTDDKDFALRVRNAPGHEIDYVENVKGRNCR